ncbi:MAG TPA: cytochrome b N-terminal domain-containing protein, partial [Patescibacteria group bacterium]|nr:cytochrome b N-terminal domain-containing protein [Patescibacteria group bacterium]
LLAFNYTPSAKPAIEQNQPAAIADVVKTVVDADGDTLFLKGEKVLLPYDFKSEKVVFPTGVDETSFRFLQHPVSQDILLPSEAFKSVEIAIMREAPFGRLVRGVHIWASYAFIFSLIIYIGAMFFKSKYAEKREIAWMLSVVLLVSAMFSGFTGYVLPWNMRAYMGAQTVLNAIEEYFPLLGSFVANAIRGGKYVGAVTLQRMFVLHVIVLPVAFWWLFKKHKRQLAHAAFKYEDPSGVDPSVLSDISLPGDFLPGLGEYLLHTKLFKTAVALLILAVLLLLVWIFPPFKNGAMALPYDVLHEGSPPAGMHPEWYFMFVYPLLMNLPGELVALILGTGLIFWLCVPFLDVRFKNNARPAWLLKAIGAAIILGLAVLILVAYSSL